MDKNEKNHKISSSVEKWYLSVHYEFPLVQVEYTVSSQTMYYNSLVVTRQNVPITSIHSETTLEFFVNWQ